MKYLLRDSYRFNNVLLFIILLIVVIRRAVQRIRNISHKRNLMHFYGGGFVSSIYTTYILKMETLYTIYVIWTYYSNISYVFTNIYLNKCVIND